MSEPKPDDIQYALETTRVLHEPARRIDTFGSTRFDFLLLSELMDSVGQVRVRRGTVQADKPQIIKPEGFENVEFEGFSEKAQEFMDYMKNNNIDPEMMRLIRYGFHMKRTDVTEEVVHEPMQQLADKLVTKTVQDGDPMLGVIMGVDDAWEFSILRFMMEMMTKSQDINRFDFQRRGLL